MIVKIMFKRLNKKILSLHYNARLRKAQKHFGEAIMKFPTDQAAIDYVEEFLMHQCDDVQLEKTLEILNEIRFHRKRQLRNKNENSRPYYDCSRSTTLGQLHSRPMNTL